MKLTEDELKELEKYGPLLELESDDGDDSICKVCNHHFALRDGCESTGYCDDCAATMLDVILPKLPELNRGYRAMLNEVEFCKNEINCLNREIISAWESGSIDVQRIIDVKLRVYQSRLAALQSDKEGM